MSDFPNKVLGEHAYVVIASNPEVVKDCPAGTVIFDLPYFPGVHPQEVLNKATGEVAWAYTTRWLFKVRAHHTRDDLDRAASRAMEREAVPGA